MKRRPLCSNVSLLAGLGCGNEDVWKRQNYNMCVHTHIRNEMRGSSRISVEETRHLKYAAIFKLVLQNVYGILFP